MNKIGIEQSLRQYSFYTSTVEGMSMYPLLRPRSDTVFIGEAGQDLSDYDVVLYHIPGGRYILHRILKAGNGYYVICGDYCVDLEYVPREYVIGKLVAFYRREEMVELTDRRYRLYVMLWCRPWRLRILLLKIGRFSKSVWRRLHENK